MASGGKRSPATEFKPGQSGNPKGKPKKLPGLAELLAEVLAEEKDGLPAAKVILMALRSRATKGDVKAAELLMNRAYGKPKDNEGAPTEMIIRVQRNG
jgi:hypothetical protein